MNKQRLVSGRSSEHHQCGFERVPRFSLCTQFRQLSHLSVYVLTHTSAFAGKVLLRARIQKYYSQVGQGWFSCFNYETGCPGILFLICRGLVLLWSSLIILVLLLFFPVQFRSNVCVDLDFTEADEETTTAGDKAQTSVRKINVDDYLVEDRNDLQLNWALNATKLSTQLLYKTCLRIIIFLLQKAQKMIAWTYIQMQKWQKLLYVFEYFLIFSILMYTHTRISQIFTIQPFLARNTIYIKAIKTI